MNRMNRNNNRRSNQKKSTNNKTTTGTSSSSWTSWATLPWNLTVRYAMLEEIGRGCFGIVRKCQHRQTKKYYACKCIMKQSPLYDNDSSNNNNNNKKKNDNKQKINDEYRQVLQREIYNLKQVQGHPNILQLHDIYEDSHHVYVITELISGKELYQCIVSHKQQKQQKQRDGVASSSSFLFDETEAAHIIYNMISAIAYCHEVHGICHRDLKASNFMFPSPVTNNSNGTSNEQRQYHDDVRVIDFGLSRSFVRQHSSSSSSSAGKKRNNVISDDIKSSWTSTSTSSSSWQEVCLGSVKKMFCGDDDNDTIGRNKKEEKPSLVLQPTIAIIPPTPLENKNDKKKDNVIPGTKHDTIPTTTTTTTTTKVDRTCWNTMTSTVGTPYYVAPEVLTQQTPTTTTTKSITTSSPPPHHLLQPLEDGYGYSSKCDVWSLGVIAYLILSDGSLPFCGADERETVHLLMDSSINVLFSYDETDDDNDTKEQEAATTKPNRQQRRRRPTNMSLDGWKFRSKSCQDFVSWLLQKNPSHRPTALQALSHEWFQQQNVVVVGGKDTAASTADVAHINVEDNNNNSNDNNNNNMVVPRTVQDLIRQVQYQKDKRQKLQNDIDNENGIKNKKSNNNNNQKNSMMMMMTMTTQKKKGIKKKQQQQQQQGGGRNKESESGGVADGNTTTSSSATTTAAASTVGKSANRSISSSSSFPSSTIQHIMTVDSEESETEEIEFVSTTTTTTTT